MEAVVLDRVGFLAYFCPKQSGFQTLSGTPIPKRGSSTPPPPPGELRWFGVVYTAKLQSTAQK